MKLLIRLLSAITAIATTLSCLAADAPVKSEMRSAWVATVWQIDWPTQTISSTGNTTHINIQKNDMRVMLDSLAVNNFNSICFQVRSRCDAMYKSSYEPWSTDLVATRGMDPGYDPLEFVVEECHKRGMECFAWVNPYRYESVVGQWGDDPNTKGCYRGQHPDWVMDYNGASILNPGVPEVRQRICDVIDEIVANYDVDGVLFDDYFYLGGTPMSADADLYKAYQATGGTLSQKDWRQDNVDKMVHDVYTTIKARKPWVRFGISPAGIACTSSTVAKKYGVTPCPTGSDWQLNDLHSNPIAWMYNKDLDFVSPQIYWTIGHTTNYDPATKWWSQMADHFGRHMYVSHSIDKLTSYSTGTYSPAATPNEDYSIKLLGSGPNNNSFTEYANEVRLNREYSLDGAPGSIFFSCKFIYKQSPKFGHYLLNTVYNTPALMPAITWMAYERLDPVENAAIDNGKISWDARNNVRYTVYAVPTTTDISDFDFQPEYMLGVTYFNSYDLPKAKQNGYVYVVCIYDRYGNEYAPAVVGMPTGSLDTPTLTYPADGADMEFPFNFKWNAVENAASYVLEVSDTPDMSNILMSSTVADTQATSGVYELPIDTRLYWRVRSCKAFNYDGVSAVRSFSATRMSITSPADAATDVSLTPEITWSNTNRQVEIQLATSPDFGDEDILLEGHSWNGSFPIPKFVLKANTTYYVRLNYSIGEDLVCTPTVMFTTKLVEPEVPTVVIPANGGTLYADQYVTIAPMEGANYFRLEVSSSTSFSGRSSYVSSNIEAPSFADVKKASEINISSKGLVDNNTYYLRVRSVFNGESGTQNSDFCAPVSFTYSSANASVDNITADSHSLEIHGCADGSVAVSSLAGESLVVKLLNINGCEAARLFEGTSTGNQTFSTSTLCPGVYVAVASSPSSTASCKIVIK